MPHYMKMIGIPSKDIRPNFYYLKFSEFADKEYEKEYKNKLVLK